MKAERLLEMSRDGACLIGLSLSALQVALCLGQSNVWHSLQQYVIFLHKPQLINEGAFTRGLPLQFPQLASCCNDLGLASCCGTSKIKRLLA